MRLSVLSGLAPGRFMQSPASGSMGEALPGPKVGGWDDTLIEGGTSLAGTVIKAEFGDWFYQRGRDVGLAVISGVHYAYGSDSPGGGAPTWLKNLYTAFSEPFARGVSDVLSPFFGKKLILPGLAVLGAGFAGGYFVRSRRK